MAAHFVYILKGTSTLANVFQSDGTTVPVAGDWLVWGEGNQTITTALTQFNALTATGAADGFEKIWIKRGVTGTLGGGGASFEADVSYNTTSVFTYDAGGGSLYYKTGTIGALCDRFKQTGFGKFYFTGGTITNLEQFRSYSNINSSGIVTNAYVTGGTLDADYNGTGFTLLYAQNCTVNCQRAITTLNVLNGSTVNAFRVDASSTLPTATTINVLGGKLNWRGGDITTINAFSPIDMSSVPNTVAVTNLNITAQALAASNLNEARTTGYPGVVYSSIKVWGGFEDKAGTSLP